MRIILLVISRSAGSLVSIPSVAKIGEMSCIRGFRRMEGGDIHIICYFAAYDEKNISDQKSRIAPLSTRVYD